jgi:hypothetical protein
MERVRIVDCAGPDGVVDGRTFADCEIIGPVQLVPVGTDNHVVDCDFPYAPDSLAQARAGGGPVLFLEACTFSGCRFALDVDTSRLKSLSL